MKSELYSKKIREISLKLVHKAKASHIGSALSIADLLGVLFSKEDFYNFSNKEDPCRDKLLLSKGHACVALYSALYLKGYFSYEELFTYGEDNSKFMNHASHHVPGVEFSTGALGHALPVAAGKALASKLTQNNNKIYVLLSDGELQEGSNWEAIMFANHYRLDNLTIFIDNNNLQSLTTVEDTISLNPLDEKFKSFGWYCKSINGHDHNLIKKTLNDSMQSTLPKAIILKTIKGKGVSYMENNVDWHYRSPSKEELKLALDELGIK